MRVPHKSLAFVGNALSRIGQTPSAMCGIADLPMMEFGCNRSVTGTAAQTNECKKNGYAHRSAPKKRTARSKAQRGRWDFHDSIKNERYKCDLND